jgi:hypothetical protein
MNGSEAMLLFLRGVPHPLNKGKKGCGFANEFSKTGTVLVLLLIKIYSYE